MKKLLFITALATTVLAGCTSDEQNEAAKQSQPSKIVFNAPIVNGNTRTVYGEQGTKYDPYEEFHVYAVWTKETFDTWAAGTPYMDVDVKYKDGSPKGWWKSETDYYWPKEGYLSFAAYSPVAASNNATKIEYGANGLSITDFKVSEAGKQYDLMYSDRTCDKQESTGGTTYSGVDINFKHALSSIVFKAKTANNYSGTTIRIKKISIYGIKDKGDFKENIKDQKARENEDNLTTGWENISGEVTETAPYIAFNETGDKEVVTQSEKFFNTNAIIALPQVITDNAKVKVEYSIQSSGSTEIEQTKIVDLKPLIGEWEMGYRYTYTINISLTKIYFSPEVKAWEDATMSSIGL